ncbi:CAP-associated domain-containing protein [Anoxynatronum sibiricum]|uniref:CAP-associated domain-containing protein n=1 Tax=Anoxynatronum sibiricum TaxID=210623 RepID=A0ABU9VX25_9CLOT
MKKETLIGIMAGIALGIMVTLTGGLFLYFQISQDSSPFITETPAEQPEESIYKEEPFLQPTQEEPVEEEPQATEQMVPQPITLGMSLEEVERFMGLPTEMVKSEYGFHWYLYTGDYHHYLQLGVLNHQVIAFYTNSAEYLWEEALMGMTKTQARQRYGTPETYIQKGNTRYFFPSPEEADRFLQAGEYLILFYDQHDSHQIHGVMKITEAVEKSLPGFHGTLSDPVRDGHEKQIFHLNNAFRANHGLPPYTWHEGAASAARKHSQDMAANRYFSHTSRQGTDPGDRLTREGVTWQMYGENIAQGPNAIFANNGWINSLGHRQNMLGDTTHLGVGSAFVINSGEGMYHTQKFVTPR